MRCLGRTLNRLRTPGLSSCFSHDPFFQQGFIGHDKVSNFVMPNKSLLKERMVTQTVPCPQTTHSLALICWVELGEVLSPASGRHMHTSTISLIVPYSVTHSPVGVFPLSRIFFSLSMQLSDHSCGICWLCSLAASPAMCKVPPAMCKTQKGGARISEVSQN